MSDHEEKTNPASEAGDASSQAAPRERILQAALELFVDQGYFNTNIPDVSKRSRCSVGSIYHHFLNKEEIAEQLYRNGIKQFRHALASALESDEDLRSTVHDLVIAFMTFSEEHLLLSRYLWLARHSEFLSTKIAQPTTVGFDPLGRKLTRLIKRGIRSGDIAHLKAEVLWSILFGMPLSYIRDWLEGYTSAPPSRVAPVLADACWAALRGSK